MSTPQIIMIALLGMDVGIALSKHGQPRNANHSIFITLFSTAIFVGLLYWGGFFGGA